MGNHIASMFGGFGNFALCTRALEQLSQMMTYRRYHPPAGNTAVLASRYPCRFLSLAVNTRVVADRIEPHLNYFAQRDIKSPLGTSAPLGAEVAFRDPRCPGLLSLQKTFHPVPAPTVVILLSSFSCKNGIPAAPGTAHISMFKPSFRMPVPYVRSGRIFEPHSKPARAHLIAPGSYLTLACFLSKLQPWQCANVPAPKGYNNPVRRRPE
jgi:hypothetical protein